MPRGRGHMRHHHTGHNPKVIEQQAKIDRITTYLDGRERTKAFLFSNQKVARDFWFNSNVVDKVDANPALLDDFERDPETRIPQFIRDNPKPYSNCCTIV